MYHFTSAATELNIESPSQPPWLGDANDYTGLPDVINPIKTIHTFFKPGKPHHKILTKKGYKLKKKRSDVKRTGSCPAFLYDSESNASKPPPRRKLNGTMSEHKIRPLKDEMQERFSLDPKRRQLEDVMSEGIILDTKLKHLKDVMPECSQSRATKCSSFKKLPPVTLKEESMSNKTLSKEKSTSTTRTEIPDSAVELVPVIKEKKKSKRRKCCIVIQVKPTNREEEKEKFFQSNFTYNPQFQYKREINQTLLRKYRDASDELLPLAVKIMKTALARHSSYEAFEEKTGGRLLGRTEVYDMAMEYIANLGLKQEVDVQLSDDLVARACMTTVNRFPTLIVRVHNIRETWMKGVLRHEIGTHFIRSYNNKRQVWRKSRIRQDMGLQPMNPTEEGLASLHSVMGRQDPSLWRCALLYYTVCMAVNMSFAELFNDIQKFVSDPHVRWDYCLRAKRGQTDSSKPGALCKDQVYLQGALQILRHRHDIDFIALIQYGKVSFSDLDLLKDFADTSETRLPNFMFDMTQYRMRLNDILLKNGLSDQDLRRVATLSL